MSISSPDPSNSSDFTDFRRTGFLHFSTSPKQTIWSSVIDKLLLSRISSPSLTLIWYFPLKTRRLAERVDLRVSLVHHSLKIKSRYFLPAAFSWKLYPSTNEAKIYKVNARKTLVYATGYPLTLRYPTGSYELAPAVANLAYLGL